MEDPEYSVELYPEGIGAQTDTSRVVKLVLTFLEEERPCTLIGSLSLLPLKLQLSLSLLLLALSGSLLVLLQKDGTFKTEQH